MAARLFGNDQLGDPGAGQSDLVLDDQRRSPGLNRPAGVVVPVLLLPPDAEEQSAGNHGPGVVG